MKTHLQNPLHNLIRSLASASILLSCFDLMGAQYFSVGATGDPTQLTSWTNSAGANPADFNSGDTFIILNGCNFTLASGVTWTVNAVNAGTAATVQINNGGTLTFTLTGSSSSLSLGGNLVQTVTGGIAGNGTAATGLILFTSNGTWTGSGNLSSPKVGVTINSGVTLDALSMSSGFVLRAGNSENITVNGTLIIGTNTISGNGGTTPGFNLNSGGTLVTANANGVPGIFTGFASGKITLSSSANYTFNGSAAQVTGTSANNATMPATATSLTFNNNAGVTLSQATTVNNLTLLAGQVTGNLTLADLGTITGGSSTAYINGQLTVQFDAPSSASFTFPIGTASGYSPVSITNFTDTGTVLLTASAAVGQNPNQTTSGIDLTEYINRTWTLTGSGFNSPTYDITGAFVAGDILNGANPATLVVRKWDGTSWAAPVSSSSVGAPTYTVTGTGFNTGFGQFTAGEAAFLPSVIATTASAITNSSATLGATVYANNGSAIDNYGIVWGTSPNPTLANHVVSAGSTPTLNNPFTVNISGLSAGTTIYYCGFATSGNGTGYSTNGTFLTLTNQPTVQASGVTGTALQNGNLIFSWARGSGSNCIVLVSAGSPVNSPPVGGTTYTASTTFGSGSQIGSGNYVAFIGTGTNVTLTGLSPNSTYYAAVYEFNGAGGSQNYLAPPATGSQTTVGNPISSITWTGSQDNNWNNANNWTPLLVPGVGTIAIIPNVATQPIYTNPMVAASFGSLTNAGILTVATNGFNSGSVFLERAGGGAQIIITNNGAMGASGNIALASNSVVTVYGGGSLTASGQLVIGCNVTNGGTSSATPGGIGIVTNNGGKITVGSTSLNPGNGSIAAGCLFVINGGTNSLGNVTIARSAAGSGGYSTLGTEGLMIYNGQVTMSGLNVGGGNGNSFLTALISGGTVTNNGSVLVNQGSSGRGSRFLQTGGLFVVSNMVNPNPTVSGSLNVYSVTGGTNVVGGIAFGNPGGGGSVFFTNSSVIYIGSQGISANSGITLTAALNGGGVFGASAPWTGSAPMLLGSGSFTFQAADMNNNPNSITLSGGLSGTGGLTKTGGGTMTLSGANNYVGNTVIANGMLALGTGGALGATMIVTTPGTTFDVSALAGAYSPALGQTLGGFGFVSGLVTATNGTIQPGSNNVTGTLTLASGLTETGGVLNRFYLSNDPIHGSNDLLAVTGTLTASGSNFVTIVGSLPNGSNYTLITYTGGFNGNVTNFGLAGVTGYLTNIANSIVLHTLATTRGPTNTVWIGNSVNNVWDTGVTTNWLNAGLLDYFISGDSVTFNNTGASNSQVVLAGDLFPGSVTVNSASNYVFGGTGFIDGLGGLTKTNSGTLTMLVTNNSYSGVTAINGGTLEASLIANAFSPSSIGSALGTDTSLLVLTNGGTLRYIGATAASTDRGITLAGAGGMGVTNGSTLTVNGTIIGAGVLTKSDTGELELNNVNLNTGGVVIAAGTLTLTNAGAAGSGTITANPNTTLRIAGALTVVNPFNVPSGTVTVDLNNAAGIAALDGAWSGAGTVNLTNMQNSTRTFTIGGNGSGGGNMTNFSGTVECGTTPGFVRFNDSGNANFGSTNMTMDLGSSTATFLVRNGGITVNVGALWGGSGTFVSGRASGASGTVTYSIGAKNLNTEFDGIIKDGNNATAITKTGTGTLTLSGVSTYTGNTVISNGVLALTYNPTNGSDGSFNSSPTINLIAGTVLDVSGRSDGTFQLGASATQMLEGRGTISGSLYVNGSGTVAPGGGPGGNTGTLTVTNSVTLGGVTWMKLNRATTPNSDRIVSSLSTVTYGGTLMVTNIGGRLQVGDTFTLFSGGGLSAGGFSTITLPNYYNWDYSNLGVNGTIQVTAALPPPAITNVDFSNLRNGSITLNIANGLANGPVTILTTANLALPVSSWTTVMTATFDGNGNLSQAVTVDPALPQSYFLLQAY